MEKRSRWLGAEDASLAGKARGFVGQPMFARHGGQLLAASGGIHLRGPPDLGLAFGTELEGLMIAFDGVVRAVHAALVGDAMPDAEHVSGLVQRGLGGT